MSLMAILKQKDRVKLLENALLYGTGVEFLIKSQNIKDNILKIILSDKDYQSVISIWIAIIRSLSDKHIILSAFEVPFLFRKNYSFLWLENLVVIFFKGKEFKIKQIPSRPTISHPRLLAVGGQSGAGKTTIFKKLQRFYPGRIFGHTIYTTRSSRPNEKDGIDYVFKKLNEVKIYKKNPRYLYFVKARSDLYWIDLGDILQNIWSHPFDLHVFFISQKQDFLEKKKIFPKLKWIWIDADDNIILQRLKERKDQDLSKSLQYNQKIKSQSLTRLVNFHINNNTPTQLNKAIKIIYKFCNNLK